MKKSLFALAAAGAFAGAAQAQSSVTVYGLIDVGYAGGNTVTRGPATSNYANTTVGAFTNNAQSTSRLGFRGTEDLGGGLSAFFTLETALGVNSSTGLFSTAGNGNRQAFVGLAKKGVGQFSIGTQYTTIFKAMALTSPGQLNNMMGDVTYDKALPMTANSTNSGMADNSSFTVRTNNMLSLETENFSGFKLGAFYSLNSTTTNRTSTTTTTGAYTGGANDQTGWGIGANFTGVPKLLVTANYQSFKSANPYGAITYTTTGVAGNAVTTTPVTAGAFALNGAGGSAVTGTNNTDNQQYYAAMYDFGILKAYAQYVARKATSEVDSSRYFHRSAQQLGVRGNITKTIEGWASAGNGRVNGIGAAAQYANFTGYQIGANYILSKRTNLYAIFGSQVTSNAQQAAGSNPVSYTANDYAVGVRHTF